MHAQTSSFSSLNSGQCFALPTAGSKWFLKFCLAQYTLGLGLCRTEKRNKKLSPSDLAVEGAWPFFHSDQQSCLNLQLQPLQDIAIFADEEAFIT